jgi:hypothetical protein
MTKSAPPQYSRITYTIDAKSSWTKSDLKNNAIDMPGASRQEKSRWH